MDILSNGNVEPIQVTGKLKLAIEALQEETATKGLCVGDTEWDKLTETGAYIEKCLACPVAIECLIQALIYERGLVLGQRFEIYGGATPAERFEMDITAKKNDANLKLAQNMKLIEYRKQNLHLKHLIEKRQKEWAERGTLW